MSRGHPPRQQLRRRRTGGRGSCTKTAAAAYADMADIELSNQEKLLLCQQLLKLESTDHCSEQDKT